MKKITRSCLTIISAMAMGVLLLSGCSSESGDYVEKTYDISAAEVETLRVDVRDRIIEIYESTDDQIHLNYFESTTEPYTIEHTDVKELSMVCASSKEWTDYVGVNSDQKSRTIQLWIPENTLNNLSLKTSNEDLVLNSLVLSGAIDLNVNNGNIDINYLNAATAIALETKNGNINGTIVGSYDVFSIQSNVKKGDCNLPAKKENGSKNLTASANNGNINIEFVE